MPTTLSFNRQHNYAGSQIPGIVVPVHLAIGVRRIKVLARIDTGATYCIFNRAYAEALDLNVEAGHRIPIRTANGEFNAFGHELTISCLEYEVHSMVYFAEHPEFNRDVLGRNGWIQNFRLGIVDYNSLLYLSRHDE